MAKTVKAAAAPAAVAGSVGSTGTTDDAAGKPPVEGGAGSAEGEGGDEAARQKAQADAKALSDAAEALAQAEAKALADAKALSDAKALEAEAGQEEDSEFPLTLEIVNLSNFQFSCAATGLLSSPGTSEKVTLNDEAHAEAFKENLAEFARFLPQDAVQIKRV